MPSPSVALLRTQSDDRLLKLAGAGHERAFEAIVERYRRPLLRRARRYLPEARAEDAVQQALVSAWTALRRGDEVRELRPWLHRIAHNTALNALRTNGYDYEELRETLEGDGGPAEAAERRAVVRGTLAGLASLPERQRDALLQIAVEGRSQDEVAADLGLTENAVRQLVHRARTTLRAAATAAIPLPLATWLATASGGRVDLVVRVGELVSGAGASAALAKAGAVAVIAGGAVAGPAVVREAHGPAGRADAADARRDAPRDPQSAATPEPRVVEVALPALAAPETAGGVARADARSERGRQRHGDGGREDRPERRRERAPAPHGGAAPDPHDDEDRSHGWSRHDDGDDDDRWDDDDGHRGGADDDDRHGDWSRERRRGDDDERHAGADRDEGSSGRGEDRAGRDDDAEDGGTGAGQGDGESGSGDESGDSGSSDGDDGGPADAPPPAAPAAPEAAATPTPSPTATPTPAPTVAPAPTASAAPTP